MFRSRLAMCILWSVPSGAFRHGSWASTSSYLNTTQNGIQPSHPTGCPQIEKDNVIPYPSFPFATVLLSNSLRLCSPHHRSSSSTSYPAFNQTFNRVPRLKPPAVQPIQRHVSKQVQVPNIEPPSHPHLDALDAVARHDPAVSAPAHGGPC